MSANWLSWFTQSPKDAEIGETLALLARVRQQHASPLGTDDQITEFIVDIIFEACERRGVTPSIRLGGALYSTIKGLLHEDALIGDLPEEADIRAATVEEGVRLRAALKRHERFLTAHPHLLPIWRDKLVWLFSGMLDYFPDSAFTDIDEHGQADDDSLVLPEARAYDLCDNLPEVIQRLIRTFYDDDIVEAHLFEPMRATLDGNLLAASGLSPDARYSRDPKIVLPMDSRLNEPSALVDAYLWGTPFQKLFYRPLPFAIPFPARFEHTHIVGGTGHGKTQLLQFMIHHDLVRAQQDGRAVVVIDSQGDLIRTISQLGYFSDPSFAERFVLVDPNDVEHPVCLNMFDFNRDRLSGYAPLDREKILNATIELYEYFFGALLGAELTQRQGLIFRYLARLLIEIPDATIHTLRELMEDGERFRPYMDKLTGTARSFFATQFFDRKFGETKKQILTRLWGVLSNASLERMFSHTRNKIDIFELLNQGKIVLINTAKELLGQEGAAIFGRFFVALIAQASIQRAALPPHERRPAFVYLDEAQDYFDDNISHLLNQARKYRVGLIFAHQNLDQLGAGLRASVLASTTIKFAGGVSAKDAGALASEFRCDASFLLSQRKGREQTEFACYVKNYTNKALTVSVPLGYVESLPQLDYGEHQALIDTNRALYCEPPQLPADQPLLTHSVDWEDSRRKANRAPPVTADVRSETKRHEEVLPEVLAGPVVRETKRTVPAVANVPRPPGQGGRQHKYLQHLVKQLAEDRGFRASVEETILDGAGRVDVSLVRDAERIAVQISVTTTKDWELGGIEKCLAAGYGEVLLVGGSEKRVKALSKFVEANLDEKSRGKVRYLTPEVLATYFKGLEPSAPKEQLVRGYRVRTIRQDGHSEDALARRSAITEVIARAINKDGTVE